MPNQGKTIGRDDNTGRRREEAGEIGDVRERRHEQRVKAVGAQQVAQPRVTREQQV
jgi:hypothetical protein